MLIFLQVFLGKTWCIGNFRRFRAYRWCDGLGEGHRNATPGRVINLNGLVLLWQT